MKSRSAGLTSCLIRGSVIIAAISDQSHAIEIEALFELGDLGLQRRGIADIAFEDFDRDRAAILIAQQPEHDLQLAVLAVTMVPELGQLLASAVLFDRRPFDRMVRWRTVTKVLSRGASGCDPRSQCGCPKSAPATVDPLFPFCFYLKELGGGRTRVRTWDQ
jgi:hypothetical protein